jgi:hypothetical protein
MQNFSVIGRCGLFLTFSYFITSLMRIRPGQGGGMGVRTPTRRSCTFCLRGLVGVQEKLAITGITCDCSPKRQFFKFTLDRMRFFKKIGDLFCPRGARAYTTGRSVRLSVCLSRYVTAVMAERSEAPICGQTSPVQIPSVTELLLFHFWVFFSILL